MKAMAMLLVTLCLSSCAAGGTAPPASLPEASSVAGRRVTAEDVAHKVALLNRLLEDSPVVRRVEASGDRAAESQLRAARKLFQRAKGALAMDDLQRADGFLDDSLRLVSAAGRAVPERERALEQQRARYSQLLESIETFRAWNERSTRRATPAGRASSSVLLDADRTRAILKGAAALERSGDVAAANKLLTEAHANITWTLSQLVANETLVYRQEFSSPQDAYRYESERYASYEDLLPIAVGALTPSAAAGALADRLFGEAEALRREAQQAADAGRHADAVLRMREAVQRLQRAFDGLGVAVPQTMPGES